LQIDGDRECGPEDYIWTEEEAGENFIMRELHNFYSFAKWY
jgi:hypothetical protein